MKKYFKIFIITALLFSVTGMSKLLAQPFNLDDRIQPTELNLVTYKKGDPKASGHINVTTVTQTQDTMYFFVKGLSMYSPAYFGITGDDHAAVINVTLNKENWHQANKKGETDDKGHWETSFKTEGDFGIMVVPKVKPAKYTLVTWVGDEAKDVGVITPFTNAKITAAGGNFFKNNLLYIVAGIAVVLLVLVIILFMKKKK
jgi:hypothetical protein